MFTLQTPESGGNGSPRELEGAIDEYALRQRTVVIRHRSNHRVVALLEILSSGYKSNRHAIRSLLDKAVAALAPGIHLLLVDLYPPGPRDPQGVHGIVWERLTEDAYTRPADKPLTLAAYVAGPVPTAYVEPVAVGDVLPEMPIFLVPNSYVQAPLEATYRQAWDAFPSALKGRLDPTPEP